MKKLSILGVILALFAFVAFAHAQCMSESGDVKVMCIKGEGMGGKYSKTIEMDCCKMVGHDGADQHGMGGCGSRFFLCCPQEFDLNESQVKRLKALQLEHKKATIRMHADVEIAELELKHLLHESEPSRSAIDSKITAMGELKTKMKKNRVHAYLDARSVLTKEQRDKCMHGACGCCGMGMKKVMEHKMCPSGGSCSTKDKKYEGQCK